MEKNFKNSRKIRISLPLAYQKDRARQLPRADGSGK
jgi:hypothetical protein